VEPHNYIFIKNRKLLETKLKIKTSRKFILGTSFALIGTLLSTLVNAQPNDTTYPDKPIKFVVPYTPGGSNDVVGRVLAEKLSNEWGQPIFTENKPGAGGNLGAALVANSSPDGYTLLITPNNLLTMNPALYKNPGYDSKKDFEAISLIATGPILLAVNSDLPVKSVEELIAYAKKYPNKLNYASAGVGTPHHLTAELFKSMAGIQMTHVPYRGAVPAVTDLAAGRVQLMFGIPNSLLPFIKTGQLRPLGISGKNKVPYLPDVPTIASSGLPGFHSELWIGLIAPKGTPSATLDKINSGIKASMSDPKVKATLENQGLSFAWSTQNDFNKLVNEDIMKWSKVIRENNITADGS